MNLFKLLNPLILMKKHLDYGFYSPREFNSKVIKNTAYLLGGLALILAAGDYLADSKFDPLISAPGLVVSGSLWGLGKLSDLLDWYDK